MMKFSILWGSLAVLMLGGCALKQYQPGEPKLITLKMAKLRFNDMGYLRKADDAVQLELFSAGHAVERFEINHLVCVSQGCMTKSGFNREYLVAQYPDDLLKQVLLGRPIFEGAGLTETASGFEQQIMKKGVAITYRKGGDQVYFKDSLNGILLRIRNIPGQ